MSHVQAGVEDQEGRPLIAYNVIPTTAEAGFDIRIPASVPLESFKKRVEEWCSEEGATFELVANSHVSECTALCNCCDHLIHFYELLPSVDFASVCSKTIWIMLPPGGLSMSTGGMCLNQG